jgi:hypothetical protein
LFLCHARLQIESLKSTYQQRRVELRAEQAGLSANVTVDTHSRDRKLAAATGPTSAGTVSR